MMRKSNRAKFIILCLAAGIFSASAAQETDPGDNLAVQRILYFYQLKKQLGDRNWPGFGLSKYDISLAYYTGNSTYIVDPSAIIGKRRTLTPIYHKKGFTIYKTARLDTTGFHMSTAYEAQDSSQLWYQHPVMLCSDYEATHQSQNDVPDLQTWSTMVMHEYFHGFQFRHPAFIRYANDSVTISNTRLQSYYDTYPWFRESIEKENQLLLNCLQINDPLRIVQLLKKFSILRELRRKQFTALLKFDLGPQEDFLEKTEGSARYMEYQLYLSFSRLPVDKQLSNMDKAYHPSAYKHFTPEQKPWLYESSSIRYFYSTGFNMLRLADKLNIAYKQHFFDNNRLTPYQLLLSQIK